MTALDQMNLHIDALFVHDERARMVAINDVERQAAPRLFLGRTVEGNIWRFRHDLSPTLVEKLEAVLVDEPIPTDLHDQAATVRRLYMTLTRYSPVEIIWEGPAWTFPARIRPSADIEVRKVTPEIDIVGDRFRWLVDELDQCGPAFVVLKQGRIASLCHSSRNTPLAAEAGVETLRQYQGRSYGTAVVSAWARAVRAKGRTPLYSTSWDNLASRALANRLGLVLYGADLHMT